MLMDYASLAGVIIAVVTLYFVLLPALKKVKGVDKFQNLIAIAVQVVLAIEQEFKTAELDPKDPEYQAKKLELAKAKKAACKKAIVDILTMYKMPVPSDSVLDRAIEVGVYFLNEKKLLGTAK